MDRPRRLVALCDCTAFYASCERVFDPRLAGRPVAVLSNNDGCVIARTAEVKALGVPMGAPYFKVKDELAAGGVAVRSSNYELYADMSRRVAAVLERFTPDVERYSIDEAFLGLHVERGSVEAERARLGALAEEVYRAVLRGTGIPIRVSIARTKTLAKAASEYARGLPEAGGLPAVCFWGHPEARAFLDALPVEDVWGVGARWGKRLRALGAETAGQMARLPNAVVRKHLSVVGLRTAYELRGVSCIPLEHAPPTRKSLVRSRSFGEPVRSRGPVESAVAAHAARAAEKLRREGLAAAHVEVFITTGRHGTGPHRSSGHSLTLAEPSNDTLGLVAAAKRALGLCYVRCDADGRAYPYRKAGVMLTGLCPAGSGQRSLLGTEAGTARPELMEAMDRINRRFGRSAVGVGSALRDGWRMRREMLSPRATTRWADVPAARVE